MKDSKFLKPCPGNMANSCRTILQKIEGDTRIVRQCSNVTKADDMICDKRIGTNLVKVIYCHCKEEGCNAAGSLTSSLGLAALLAIVAKLLV